MQERNYGFEQGTRGGAVGTEDTRAMNAAALRRSGRGNATSSKRPIELSEDDDDDSDYYVQVTPSTAQRAERKKGATAGGSAAGEKPKRRRRKAIDPDTWIVREPMPGGPCDGTVIPSYGGHIARRVWEGQERDALVPRSQQTVKWDQLRLWRDSMRPEVRAIVDSSGLSELPSHMFRHLDVSLISAFVERWQPDTNTFHLPFGEMTIMLHDVFHILRLPVDGEPVTLQETVDSLKLDVRCLLGISERMMGRQKEYWDNGVVLNAIFQHCKEANRAPDMEARGYLLAVLGCCLLPDKSMHCVKPLNLLELKDLNKVSGYSWGSAALVFLYRQMGMASRINCVQISGCLTLLQAWIFEYFPMFRPRRPQVALQSGVPRVASWSIRANEFAGDANSRLVEFRRMLDEMSADQVNWLPYGPDPAASVPRTVFNGLLQHRRTMEPYMPDRVLRQLGYVQSIPFPILPPEEAHRPGDGGGYEVIFAASMAKSAWFQFPRSSRLVLAEFDRAIDASSVSGDYMDWYMRYSHPIMSINNPNLWMAQIARVSTPLLSCQFDAIQDGQIRGACEAIVGVVQRWKAMRQQQPRLQPPSD